MQPWNGHGHGMRGVMTMLDQAIRQPGPQDPHDLSLPVCPFRHLEGRMHGITRQWVSCMHPDTLPQ